jgi:hypothetical protein
MLRQRRGNTSGGESVVIPEVELPKPGKQCDSRHVVDRDDIWASPLDVFAWKSDAAFNREYQGAGSLTSSVSVDYTANLRCTHMSSATS